MRDYKDLTKEELLKEIELGLIAQPGIGLIEGMDAINDPLTCFGEAFMPDDICLEQCNAKCTLWGEEVALNMLCKALCAGSKHVGDIASRYYRPKSGSYYVVKALTQLGEATVAELVELAEQYARIDGRDEIDMEDRVTRTLVTLKSENKVRKTGHGKTAIYSLEGVYDGDTEGNSE